MTSSISTKTTRGFLKIEEAPLNLPSVLVLAGCSSLQTIHLGRPRSFQETSLDARPLFMRQPQV